MLIALLFALGLDQPVPVATVAASAPAAAPAPVAAPAATPAQPPPLRLVLPPPAAPASAPDLRAVWRDHPSLRAPDIFRIDFSAKFQLDSRDPGDDPAGFDNVEVHRMRVGIEGHLFNHFEYEVEYELTERELFDPETGTRNSAWKDAYLEVNYTSAAQVRLGKFKIPYGLDQTSSSANLDFVYRSLGGRYLSSGRDIGGMVHGRVFDRRLNYSVGIFKQDGENSRNSKIEGADETFATRVTIAPLPARPALEIGGSFTTSVLANASSYPNGLRGRTVMSDYVYFAPVYVEGNRRRYGVDLDWTVRSFGARAEYMFVTDTRDGQGLSNQDLVDARGRSWYVLGTWVMTGEAKQRPVTPKNGGLFRGGIGALELAARYDQLRFDSADGGEPPARTTRAVTIYPNNDRVLTLGLNYYMNRWVKLQFNTMRENLEDAERSSTADGAPFWSQVFRLQLEL